MLDPSDQKGREQARAVALAGQLGIAVGTPVVICGLGGYFLEQRYPSGGWWVIGGVLLGVFGGLAAGYKLLSPYLYRGDDEQK